MERKLRLCEDKRLHLSECSECPDLEDQIEKAQQCCDNAQSRIDTVEEQKASKTEVDTAIGAVEFAQAATNQRVDALESGKQDELVSGVNLKTVNNNSLLGSGNINISGGGSGVENWVDGGDSGSVRTSTALTEDSSYSLGEGAVAEGVDTGASGDASHAEGRTTTASGVASHAEGSVTIASGDFSHAGGVGTTAQRASQQVFGEYNTLDTSGNNESDKGDYVEIVGNGTDNLNRSNARTLDWAGNEVLAGTLTVGADPTNNMEVATKQYVDAIETGMQDAVKDYVRTADYATCPTAGATAAKSLSIPSITAYEDGMTINVRFANGNTASNPTMNLNNLGSKPIYRYGNTPAGNSEELSWYSGEIISLVYSTDNNPNGCWVLKGWNNTTYSSLAPASGGADESLVTTGEKYTWNGKQDELVSGTNIKTINNNSLLGSGNINIGGGGGTQTAWYGTCPTGSDTSGKIVTTTTGDFSLTAGNTVAVTFSHGTTVTSTLNVDNTGAVSARIYPPIQSIAYYWTAGETVTFVYNGTYFLAVGKGMATTSFYGLTILSSSVSSTQTTMAATPSAVKQAYDLANGKQDALVSGTNIKTVNGNSLLGSGDITIGGATNWANGSTTGSVRTVGSAVEDSSYTMGADAVAEGSYTQAAGDTAHAEGCYTFASAFGAHAEGLSTVAFGEMSHAEGTNTLATRLSQHVFGEYNVPDTGGTDETTRGNYVEIVGNGSLGAESNARTLDWNGNEVLAGKLTVGAAPTANMDVATKQYADTKQARLVSGTNIKTVNSTSLLGSGDVAVQPTLVSGTNIKTINSTSLLGSGDISLPTITTTSVTITVANWNATTTCTKSVTGVTASNTVIVAPIASDNSMAEWCYYYVACTGQGNGTLTFEADSTPSADITVNVVIIG